MEAAGEFTCDELKTLLRCRPQKPVPSKLKRKNEMIKLFLDTPAPSCLDEWRKSDEDRLTELKSKRIAMKDTAIGVATKKSAKSVVNNLDSLEKEDKDELLAALLNLGKDNVDSNNNDS